MENPFKKYFSDKETDGKDKARERFNNFKKFDYEDDEEFFDLDDLFSEFHSKSFNFQDLPPGIMKQFQEIIEAMNDQDPQRRKLFENKYNDFREKSDRDLDGQLYADQLDILLKRISPDLAPKNSAPSVVQKIKLSDEDKIMDIIHGTFKEEIVPVKPRKRQVQKIPASPHHFGGLPPFDLPPSSTRTWGRTVISIRKGDGTYEERKMEQTPDGQTRTTITKTNADGTTSTSSTQTFSGEGQNTITKPEPTIGSQAERNLVTFNGYKIPCLW